MQPFAVENVEARDLNTKTPVTGPDGVCRPKLCQPCQTVNASDGSCLTKPGWCLIGTFKHREKGNEAEWPEPL